MITLRTYLLMAVLLAFNGWLAYEHYHLLKEGAARQLEADAAGAERQRRADQARIDKGNLDHAKEIAGLNALYGGEYRIVRYNLPSRPLPAPAIPADPSPPTGVVSCDGEVHPDRERAYELLERAGDTLAADCRELNEVTR